MKKLKIDDEEVMATLLALPNQPPEDTVDELDLSCDVLLYRSEIVFDPLEQRKRKMASVICTACGEKTYLEQVSFTAECSSETPPDSIGFIDPADNTVKYTGETCVCPQCGAGMEALHVGRFKDSSVIDNAYCVTVHNVRGHIALLKWYAAKHVDKLGKTFVKINQYDGAVFVNGTPIRVTGHFTNMNRAEHFYGYWSARMKFEDRIAFIDRNGIMDFEPDVVNLSDCANSGFIEYLNSGDTVCPATYLYLWTKHPQIENLVKNGLSGYVTSVIDDCYNTGYYYERKTFSIAKTGDYINWKEKKPHNMLRVEKPELHIARERSLDVFRKYVEFKKKGIKLDDKQLDTLSALSIGGLHELIKEPYYGYSVPIVRLLNYLAQQIAGHDKVRAKIIDFGYIRDYWKAVYEVYGRLEASLLYPKDVITAHDNMIVRVKEKESAAVNAKMQALNEDRVKYTFKDEKLGLMLFACQTHGELIAEGKMLQHCVAGYADNHAAGRTTVCFIRKIEAPDVPFYTLEYKNGKVVQNRGFKNCDRTPEVEAFEAEWLEYIKKVERKDNGKYNNQCVAAGAGT